MKKVIAAVFAMSLASSAMAAGNIGIEVGTSWYRVNYTDNVGDNLFGQGQTLAVTWTLDNDLSLGAYNETGTWTYDGGPYATYELNAITISKGIVKNVAIGMNLGSMSQNWSGSNDNMVTDIFGSVVILGGSGDKVSGTLKSTIAARFAPDYQNGYDWSGLTVGLSVGLLF